MKDYNQMVQAVFRRRDEYLALRKKKQAMLLKAGIPLCALVLVVLLGVTMRMNSLPEIPSKPTNPTVSVTTDIGEATEQTQVASSATEQMTQKTQPATEQMTQQALPLPEQEASQPITFAPTDPVEVPVAKPDTPQSNQKPTPDYDSSVEVPPCSPQSPMVTVPATVYPEFVTDPTDDAPPATESPTMGGTNQEHPSVDATGATVTEPDTGPLEVIINGEKCTVQTGDMITYTAELYVKDLFESFLATIAYSDSLDIIEVVDPSEEDPAPIHFPNLTGGDQILNYHYSRNNTDGKLRACVVGSKLSGYNFKEQKVLLTFDLIAKSAGEAEIALEIHDLHRKGDGTPYFKNKQQLIFSGIACEEYITVTPADEVVIPTAPKEEEESVPPFTYPEESTDGELLIHADGRTYGADVGQRITYVVELEAQEKFEYVNAMVTYGENLDLLVPESTDEQTASELASPELGGSGGIRFNEKYTENGQYLSAVKLDASRMLKYDFRRRKVLIALDFIVAKAGEANIDLIIQELTIEEGATDLYDPHKFTGTAYFYGGEQLIYDGIEVYEYVIVH